MAYDPIIRNGKIIDGSGLPGFSGGRRNRPRAHHRGRTSKRGGTPGDRCRRVVVAPGIIDNHTHYDAQMTWDPLCTYSRNLRGWRNFQAW
jgi:N-acyl-D-aspartate/D-glutamate deacylase